MALSNRRRGDSNGLNAWPGYVDALSTLLMVIIFVLLVFVLGQAFLSVALSGRDRALDRLNRQVAELSDMLSLEHGRSAELQASIGQLHHSLDSAEAARDALARQIAQLNDAASTAGTARDAAQASQTQLAAELADARLQLQSSTARAAQLQSQLAGITGQSSASSEQAAKLVAQVQQLLALRDQLEKQAQDAAMRATTEAERRAATAAQLAEAQKFSDSARAQMALLSQQVGELRAQLQQVAAALDLAQQKDHAKDVEITNLGSKLNVALASKVAELQQYRSEFFGRLRSVLAGRPGIAVVGDRFVFQSEVLFPPGSADLTEAGDEQIAALAGTLKDLTQQIPPDLHWILRVDGHADHQPIGHGAFASNWELSSARAITVVKRLIAAGVPPDHLAATGFADFQPLDPGTTPDAYARNRRIELRLTDR